MRGRFDDPFDFHMEAELGLDRLGIGQRFADGAGDRGGVRGFGGTG